MKEFSKFLVIFLVLSILSANLFSQVTETSDAGVSATIIETGSMAKTINTDFGNVTLTLSAFVKMAPIGTQPKAGGIVLPVSSGTFTAAIYEYTGTTGFTYSISYPASPIIIRNGQSEMQVASFTSEPARNAGSDLIAGVFVSVSPTNVTVNYN